MIQTKGPVIESYRREEQLIKRHNVRQVYVAIYTGTPSSSSCFGHSNTNTLWTPFSAMATAYASHVNGPIEQR